jgi:hypothetical protein
MFLTCVPKIFYPSSLNVKLHHCKKNVLFGLSTLLARIWPQFLIETKRCELLQICKHECDGPPRPLNLDLQKLLKNLQLCQFIIYQSNKKENCLRSS